MDPSVWKIVDSKLYLNYDAGVGNEWRKEIPEIGIVVTFGL